MLFKIEKKHIILAIFLMGFGHVVNASTVLTINAQYLADAGLGTNTQGDVAFTMSDNPGVIIWDWTNKFVGTALTIAKENDFDGIFVGTKDYQGFNSISSSTFTNGPDVANRVNAILFLTGLDYGPYTPFAVAEVGLSRTAAILVTDRQVGLAAISLIKNKAVNVINTEVVILNSTSGLVERLDVAGQFIMN